MTAFKMSEREQKEAKTFNVCPLYQHKNIYSSRPFELSHATVSFPKT